MSALEEQGRCGSPDHIIDSLIDAGPVGAIDDCVSWLDELVTRTDVKRTDVKRTALSLDVLGNLQSTKENMARFAKDVLPKI